MNYKERRDKLKEMKRERDRLFDKIDQLEAEIKRLNDKIDERRSKAYVGDGSGSRPMWDHYA